jgi:hypothetical protein
VAKDPVRRADGAVSGREARQDRDVRAFLDLAAAMPRQAPRRETGRGRLMFAMDATASRQATWEQARAIQVRMFGETAALGGLQIKLCYYRGLAECRTSQWVDDAETLARLMGAVHCEAGLTQIRRVLQHAIDEARSGPFHALVLVVDCMEEGPDRLAALAGELGLLKVPVFVFQEGFDAIAERTFRDIARLSGGAFCRFDAGSPEQLRRLLTAVAVYAAGGRKALQNHAGDGARLLLGQLR